MPIKRILTGMRTTGRLHLGHYVGALKQWLELQRSGGYECFFLLADVQALTTHADQPDLIEDSVRQVILDWLAVGLDPHRPNVHFVLQSAIPERFELSAYLMMLATYREISRNPTLKEELRGQAESRISMGFMAYPVDQVADITIFSPYPVGEEDELLVPVGEDQLPHLEYARVLARRFNLRYGEGERVLMPCRALIGSVGRLVGTDGNEKMSKSLGNTIDLADPPEAVERKVMRMFTDPSRKRRTDPGHPETCPVFLYHTAFNAFRLEERALACQAAGIGCVDCKRELVGGIDSFLGPIRRRRKEAEEKADLRSILDVGNCRAREIASQVIAAVRSVMHLDYPSL